MRGLSWVSVPGERAKSSRACVSLPFSCFWAVFFYWLEICTVLFLFLESRRPSSGLDLSENGYTWQAAMLSSLKPKHVSKPSCSNHITNHHKSELFGSDRSLLSCFRENKFLSFGIGTEKTTSLSYGSSRKKMRAR